MSVSSSYSVIYLDIFAGLVYPGFQRIFFSYGH